MLKPELDQLVRLWYLSPELELEPYDGGVDIRTVGVIR